MLGGGDDEHLRCKGCPRHAADKQVFFEHVKAAALRKVEHRVEYNAIRMRSARARHIHERKVVMLGNNDKALSIEGELNRPLGHYLG